MKIGSASSLVRNLAFGFLAILLTIGLLPLLSPAPASAADTGLTRLNMKSYGNHNATYDARILNIRPQFVIDNPPHGLYGEMQGYNDSWLLQNVKGYQAAGIKVIGYITSGYEGRGGDDGYSSSWYSLEMNKKLITNMALIDRVDGVFIDEVSAYPGAQSKQYLKTLTDLAHSYGLITWGNTGVDQFDEWFFTEGGFDYMQSSEAWRGQALSAVQKKWGSRISVTGFNRSYTADDAYRLTIDAWNKGLAFAYINTTEYTSIAPWFEEYAGMLRFAGGTVTPTPAPSPTPSPTPTPSPSPSPSPTPLPSPTPSPIPANQPPVLSPIGNKSVSVGQSLSFTVTASDPDGNPLTYSAANLPDGATFNAASRAFSWTPGTAGTYGGIRFQVSDGALSDSEDIAITVATVPVSSNSTTVEITKSIAAGADDGFSGSWAYARNTSWCEIGNPGSPYNAWFRFTGIDIPAGATILEARLELVQSSWPSGARLKIRAEKTASPTAPTSTADHAARARTAAGIDWDTGYSDRSYHASPDFAPVIQELVNSFSYDGGVIQVLVDNDAATAEAIWRTFESGSPPRLYVRYQVGAANTDPAPVPEPPATEYTVQKSIAAGADDGFAGDWGFYRGLRWYEIGNPGAAYNAWFRFTGISIPKGATVLEARLELRQAAWGAGTRLKVTAEKSADPAAPGSTLDLESRASTMAGIDWDTGYSDWSWHSTPDLTAVIQELVNAYGYSGGAIQLLVSDDGSSRAESIGQTFESGYAPRLYIRYKIN